MSYDSRAVANHFLKLATEDGKVVDNMKLQKLLYYAHGHWLAEHDGRPLLNEAIQAWRHGPVVQTIYDQFKHFGLAPITTRAANSLRMPYRLPWDTAGVEVRAFLESVYKKYGRFSSRELSQKTHEVGTPWADVYTAYGGNLPRFKEIPDKAIQAYFLDLSLGDDLF